MMVLMLSIDKTILREGSPAWQRANLYRSLVDDLAIIVPDMGHKWRYLLDGYMEAAAMLKIWKGQRIVVTSQDGLTNILALILSVRFKFGLEVQIHTDIFSPYYRRESFKNWLRIFGYWLGVRRAGSVRVVSRRIKENLVAKWRVERRKIRVLPIFVDVAHYQSDVTGNFLRKEYPEFSHIVLMASRLSREKNFPLALKVFAEVRKKFPKVGLVVVGNGPEREKIKGEGIILRGWSNDLVPFYKSADIFLLTSDYEGYGLTLIEAGLCRTPIVTTNVGVVGECINAKNALIAEPHDGHKLATHINFLLQNESVRIMMRERLGRVSDWLLDKEDYLKSIKQSWALAAVGSKNI